MSTRRHPRSALFGLVALLIGVGACGDEPKGSTTPDFCDAYPCDPHCADLDTRCSDLCRDSASVDASCPNRSCDALCDPCDDRCHACQRCAERVEGPAMSDVHCDATAIGDDVHPDRWEVRWTTHEEHPSWLLSIWGENGEQLAPVLWTLPNDHAIDFETWTEFAAHQQNISPTMVTLLTPMAPQFEHLLVPGEHRISVDLESGGPPCWHWTPQQPEKPQHPYALRLRLIAVGTAYAEADDMRQDPLLRAALERTQAKFHEAGIDLYVREWVVADAQTRDLYREISDVDEARALLRALPPREVYAPIDALTVDVAMVDRFTNASKLSGLSGGLPGPVALHGQDAAGVVVSAGLLPHHRGDEQVGMILTHELGHYLGLRHTSSWPNLGPDPLADTPECPKAVYTSDTYDCPDAYNVMFPVLSMLEPHWWSQEQKQVMRWHPAVTQRTP